jgi:hypothetical protein
VRIEAEQAHERELLRGIRAVESHTDQPGRQRARGSGRSRRATGDPGQHRIGCPGAAREQALDVPERKVETREALHVGPNEQIIGAQRIRRLLEEKLHQAVGDEERRVTLEGVLRVLGGVYHDDPLGTIRARHGDGDVGG